MPLTPACASRNLGRASLNLESVDDPRASNRKHSLEGIIHLVVVSLACCKLSFRDIEDVGRDIGPKLRRRLGLTKGSVADNTMWELISVIDPEQFRSALTERIKQDLASKAITNDLFAGGVATFDGKGVGSKLGATPDTDSVRESVCDAKGTPYWDAFALRVSLTSSSVKPVLDQEFLKSKEQESTVFPKAFERVITQFPKLFEWVTVDAGLTSNSNATIVREHNKKYLFALKANFRKLYPMAVDMLEGEPVLASTTERVAGCNVTRELRRVEFPSDYRFKDADELWGVRQITVGSEGEYSVDDRIFIVPEHKLKSEACLRLVRLHWGIENGPNWTADVVLREDTRTPCGVGNGVLVMAWLRLFAYNFLSIFRVHLPKRDRNFDRWQHVASLVYKLLVTYDYVFLSSKERATDLSELTAAIA